MSIRPIQQWPGDLTRARQRSPFFAKWSDTLHVLGRELRALNARGVALQIAMREQDFRIDGYPRANAKPEHPGVILSFESKYGPLSYPCDRFWDWQDNVRAIALAMEALRKVDRYGVTKRGEQYTGWKALPAGTGAVASGMTATDAAEILLRIAVGPDEADMPRHVEALRRNRDDLRETIRQARIMTHPDRRGGDRAQWNLVENASDTLRRAGWLPAELPS
jgi:hypothetical protein